MLHLPLVGSKVPDRITEAEKLDGEINGMKDRVEVSLLSNSARTPVQRKAEIGDGDDRILSVTQSPDQHRRILRFETLGVDSS